MAVGVVWVVAVGVETISAGVETIVTGVGTISAGVETIVTGVETISAGVETISAGVNAIVAGVEVVRIVASPSSRPMNRSNQYAASALGPQGAIANDPVSRVKAAWKRCSRMFRGGAGAVVPVRGTVAWASLWRLSMSVLPSTKIEQIQFCEAHVPLWAAAPAAIGLTAAQVTALSAATMNARKSFDAAQAARDASKAATTSLNADAGTMRDQAADLIRVIKGFADLQSNPAAVYAAAQIPMPAAPQPLPAPGKPNGLVVTLESTGAITLSWEADNAAASSGAFYTIARKIPGQSGFTGIGGAPGTTAGSRRMTFTDTSIPTSAASLGAQYIITGQRGTVVGTPSDAIVVQFGVDGLGATVTGASLSMAA